MDNASDSKLTAAPQRAGCARDPRAVSRVAESAGIDRAQLAALVRASVENRAAAGAPAALTGPIAYGDEQTVRRQRAVAERSPEDLHLFDALADATGRLAATRLTAA
jgi:predicted short-subunit dehydrogenase-like oxidoreductase (DUF2520 family)